MKSTFAFIPDTEEVAEFKKLLPHLMYKKEEGAPVHPDSVQWPQPLSEEAYKRQLEAYNTYWENKKATG